MVIIDIMISIILHITSFGENFYQFNEVIVKVISYKKDSKGSQVTERLYHYKIV